MANREVENSIIEGLATSFIDYAINSEIEYRPRFVSNDYSQGRKVLAEIEEQLKKCDSFIISVAFITDTGLAPLLQTFQELEERNVYGKILTTDYLNFSSPGALEKLNSFSNIDLKVYKASSSEGFHTKGYLFKREELWHIITGSSNITSSALCRNKEWNTKIVSTEKGEYFVDILSEFDYLWSKAEIVDEWIETYKEIYANQKQTISNSTVISIEDYRLEPNDMQISFINNLKKLIDDNQKRALLISATGTGKTYASAFALRELNVSKALFVVHRGQLAIQAMESYKRIFGDTLSMGLLSGDEHDYNSDIIFATVQTLSKDEHLGKFDRELFDVIVIDEVHRAGAVSHQKIVEYFKPKKLLLGMSASPERTDGFDIYSLFDHNIAHEIRLQHALEKDLLCPFHYFGVSDIEVDGKVLGDEEDFNNLILDDRVDHIIDKISYYGYSGDRVKGLIFCSRKQEAAELSRKFNERGYRTVELSGEDSQEKRLEAIDRLVGNNDNDALDYIFSVDIFNEGVDIPEVNQIVMLRPTQSPVVFVQQLGRGLRKAKDKDFVIVIDFIGNYNNNFMIPMALSGDRSYNKDNIRKYLREGTRTIPGESSVHFDKISRQRIYEKIDEMSIGKRHLKDCYKKMKFKLGRIPTLIDFHENGEVDPLLIISVFKSYYNFVKYCDSEYTVAFSEEKCNTLEFLSETIVDGKRLHELIIIQMLLNNETISEQSFSLQLNEAGEEHNILSYLSAIRVIRKEFLGGGARDRYEKVDIIEQFEDSYIISSCFKKMLEDDAFYNEIIEIVSLGMKRFHERYSEHDENNLVLYEKYSRKDVCRILNWDKNEESTIYGYRIKHNTCPIFVTYKKLDDIAKSTYYPDHFINENVFKWATRNKVTLEHNEVVSINNHKKTNMAIPLFIKKSDGEGTDFYYMGTVEPEKCEQSTIKNDRGEELPIVYFYFNMDNTVREDIYEYFVEGA